MKINFKILQTLTKHIFLIFLYFILNTHLYPQESIPQDRKFTPLFSNRLEFKNATDSFKSKALTNDALFLALKGGYQTISPEYDKNFAGSLLIDFSAGGVFNNSWQAGLSLRYWNSNIENYTPEGADTSYNKRLKGMAVLFFGNYKFILQEELIIPFIGFCFGNYEINLNKEKRQYLCIGLNTGLEVKINKFIAVNFDICFNRLLNFVENRNSYNNFEFKFGPAFYLSY